MKIKLLFAVATALGLAGFAQALHAQVVQTVNLNIAVTHESNFDDNGTVTTVTSGKESRHTSDLLEVLAKDENAAGLYPNTNFPSGAKLVVSNGVFQVVNSSNGLLVTVSNILTFTLASPDQVAYGKQNDSTGLASPTITTLQIGKIVFDDTAIVGGQDLEFFLQGLVKLTQTDAVNTKTGMYTETLNAQMTGGAGAGTSDGEPFIVTGTITANGKGTFPLVP